MSTPPNAHLYDANQLRISRIHAQLTKSIEGLGKLLGDFDNVGIDDVGKSIVLASSSTFEKTAARCVSVHFNGATAIVSYDDFSHGYKNPTAVKHDIDLNGFTEQEVVPTIIATMKNIEPITKAQFGQQAQPEQRLWLT